MYHYGEVAESNTAAVGSLALEFGTLSRLTGDPAFEDAAKTASRALWKMRSRFNLMGSAIDVVKGTWINKSGGVGAGGDSFYEYLMKAYILLGK